MSDPLRVLYFVSNYHRLTGSQRSLFLMLRALPAGAVEPVVVFPGEGPCTRMYRDGGLRVVVEAPPPDLDEFGGRLLRIGMGARLRLAATKVAPYSVKLAGIMRRERTEVAHFNNTRSALLGAWAALALRVPRIWHVRGDERSLGTYSAISAALADRIILVADGVRSSVPRAFRHKCRTVYNGIEPPATPPRRTRAELLASLAPAATMPADAVLFTIVGSVVPFKGAHRLLEAAALLAQRDADLACRLAWVFVGDFPVPAYERKVREMRDQLGVPNVAFAGWDDEPLDWIRASDVVVLPTIEKETLELEGRELVVHGTEGFSRTVLEAMSCGRPVVGTTVSGVPEQIADSLTGLLVPPSAPVAMADALGRLGRDGALRARMGAEASIRVRRFSTRATAEGTLAVYRELVRRARLTG